MNNPHPTASYPAKAVHTILLSLAKSFHAVLCRPEYLPYQAATDIVHGRIQTTVEQMDLNHQEKKACEELEKIFIGYWKPSC